MSQSAAAVTTIAHQIQLALAPVFLLAGIAGFINVLVNRLARSIDRARQLEKEPPDTNAPAHRLYLEEHGILDRRMHAVYWAVTCCTAAALLICVVVALLFVADLTRMGFARPLALLFILAMLFLITGLILFLYEVRLATKARRIWRQRRLERLAE